MFWRVMNGVVVLSIKCNNMYIYIIIADDAFQSKPVVHSVHKHNDFIISYCVRSRFIFRPRRSCRILFTERLPTNSRIVRHTYYIITGTLILTHTNIQYLPIIKWRRSSLNLTLTSRLQFLL